MTEATQQELDRDEEPVEHLIEAYERGEKGLLWIGPNPPPGFRLYDPAIDG